MVTPVDVVQFQSRLRRSLVRGDKVIRQLAKQCHRASVKTFFHDLFRLSDGFWIEFPETLRLVRHMRQQVYPREHMSEATLQEQLWYDIVVRLQLQPQFLQTLCGFQVLQLLTETVCDFVWGAEEIAPAPAVANDPYDDQPSTWRPDQEVAPSLRSEPSLGTTDPPGLVRDADLAFEPRRRTLMESRDMLPDAFEHVSLKPSSSSVAEPVRITLDPKQQVEFE